MSVVVSDTAGIRTQTDDVIEREGIRRAWAAAEEADIVLCVVDASRESSDGDPWYGRFGPGEKPSACSCARRFET